MRDIRIAAAQFEARDADKEYNFERLAAWPSGPSDRARSSSASTSAASPAIPFSRNSRPPRSSNWPSRSPPGRRRDGWSNCPDAFNGGAARGVAGKATRGDCSTATSPSRPRGSWPKHRKLHEFISPHLGWGDQLRTFELCGMRCGILTCYDNNLVENPRILTLQGAEVIFAPHVTCGLESPMRGEGRSRSDSGTIASATRSRWRWSSRTERPWLADALAAHAGV